MKEFIKKHDNISLTIIMVILSIAFSLMVSIETSDEIWNFQNVCKMVNGYKLYVDANVIITPIFFVIAKMMLQIFGTNIFVFRIYNVIIYVALILLIYNIFKALGLKKIEALFYTMIAKFALNQILLIGANYNTLAMVMVLLGVYTIIKIKDAKKINILNGIIMYLVLFTKQNVGIYYIIATIVLQILLSKINKQTIKNITKQMLILIVLVAISLLAFKINGNLEAFINYTILGIGEFSNNVLIEIETMLYLLLCIALVVISVVVLKMTKNENQKRNILILLILGLPMLLYIYPISNIYHMKIGGTIFIILGCYISHTMILKDFITKKVMKTVILIIIAIYTLLSCICIIKYYKNFNINPNDIYFGGIITKERQESINKVNDYIEEKNNKVIIFSKDAAIYNIPKKRSNGAIDLPFLGNMGAGGEDLMLENVKNMHGYEILIKDVLMYQESEKIVTYIKENYEKIGEIEEFQIYKIN